MDTARDTTRQYKGMQEELITKLKQRERTIQELTDEIQTVKTQHAIQIEKKVPFRIETWKLQPANKNR